MVSYRQSWRLQLKYFGLGFNVDFCWDFSIAEDTHLFYIFKMKRLDQSVGRIGTRLNVHIVLKDITAEKVDAITNAANEDLMHGGGVAGAISRKGGPLIQKESYEYVKTHGRVRTGTCGYTSGGKLDCKYVIHAVGPIWSNKISREANIELLFNAVTSTLKMAEKLDCKSVSIPAISSGIFGFPKPLCAETFFKAIEKYCTDVETGSLEDIRLTNFDTETTEIF